MHSDLRRRWQAIRHAVTDGSGTARRRPPDALKIGVEGPRLRKTLGREHAERRSGQLPTLLAVGAPRRKATRAELATERDHAHRAQAGELGPRPVGRVEHGGAREGTGVGCDPALVQPPSEDVLARDEGLRLCLDAERLRQTVLAPLHRPADRPGQNAGQLGCYYAAREVLVPLVLGDRDAPLDDADAAHRGLVVVDV